LSRWTIEQLNEKPELLNLLPPGPVINPSWTKSVSLIAPHEFDYDRAA